MTQYLITEIKDSTGYIHRHVTKVKENEYMRVVEADSKEEANIKRIQAIKLPDITLKDRLKGIVGRFFRKWLGVNGMIVYLPHYNNGEETCDNSHGISDKAYTSLEDAIQEIKELGYVIQEDKSDEIELMGFPDIEINSEILPFVFYKEPFKRFKKTPTYSFDDREFAFINKIELVEGETDV